MKVFARKNRVRKKENLSLLVFKTVNKMIEMIIPIILFNT